MNRMSDYDKGWLIGLLEGEATIGCWNASGRKADIPSKHVKYAKVSISSTDRDVLDHILKLTGIGSIILHYGAKSKKKESHKQSWTWTVGAAEDVLDILDFYLTAPLISEHRQDQIREAHEAAFVVAARKKSGESFSRKK